MNTGRREFNPRGKYLRLRTNGKVFRVETIVVQDEEKGTYYITDAGEEIKSEDCFVIDIPGAEGFAAVIKEYPDAIEQRCAKDLESKAELELFIRDKYSGANKLSALEELKQLKKRCREIEKLLGIE